jgi:hypothetical protein
MNHAIVIADILLSLKSTILRISDLYPSLRKMSLQIVPYRHYDTPKL